MKVVGRRGSLGRACCGARPYTAIGQYSLLASLAWAPFRNDQLCPVATRSAKGRLTHLGRLLQHAPEGVIDMEVIHPRCCGIDVHKATVCACISIKDAGVIEKHKRRFDTNTAQLRELASWLRQYKVTNVAMEATGVYWKPVWNLLQEEFELLLVNPQPLKPIP